MNKIVIESLNKVNIINTKEVNFLGTNILIKDYLPMEEKMNIAELVLQNSMDYNFVNDMKSEVFFNVFVVIKYTNLDLSELCKDINNAYDIIARSGLLQTVVDYAKEDIDELYDYVDTLVKKQESYEQSISGLVERTLSKIPEQLNQTISELENLDLTKISNVMNSIAENGGNQNAVAEAIMGQK